MVGGEGQGEDMWPGGDQMPRWMLPARQYTKLRAGTGSLLPGEGESEEGTRGTGSGEGRVCAKAQRHQMSASHRDSVGF